MKKKLVLTILLTLCALIGMAFAKPKRLMVLNHAGFDLSGGRVKITATFTNLTKKPLGNIYLGFKCVDAAGSPVVGDEEQITKPGQKIAPRVPASFSFTSDSAVSVEKIKACACTLSVERGGQRLDQDTYSVQIQQ